MTNQQHPITPPPELVSDWAHMLEQHTDTEVFTQAARWGADQELEACCLWLDEHLAYENNVTNNLRAARRPKPLSLKEQALLLCDDYIDPEGIIRRALESLPS